MRQAPVYAVLYDGNWSICYLVLATEFTTDDTHWSETPIWSNVETTEGVCYFDQADHVIPLKEPN